MLSSVFCILVILIGVWWYLAALIGVFLICDVEHLSKCSFGICISSLVRCLRSWACFLVEFFFVGEFEFFVYFG